MPARNKGPKESPTEGFERLKQGFETLKSLHTEPWCWHDYLSPEPDLEEDDSALDDDPETYNKKPKPRSNVDRVKQHLFETTRELQRTMAAADAAYVHVCTKPEMMRECIIILGSGGDIDEDLLNSSGDASPQKIIGALQAKLDLATERIELLQEEVEELKSKLVESRYQSEDRWQQWQRAAMLKEEALTKLHWASVGLGDYRKREERLKTQYLRLRAEWIRASRLMTYHAVLRVRGTLSQYKKENMFYAFVGFTTVVTQEKEERIRAEHEAKRDAVEFALRYEGKFLRGEVDRRNESLLRLVNHKNKMHNDRRSLACKMLGKYRPYDSEEYYLWIWELWQDIRCLLRVEKLHEREYCEHAAASQMLIHTSNQIPLLSRLIDVLRRDLALERTEHSLSKRELCATSGKQMATLSEFLTLHRSQEQKTTDKLHLLTCEDKDEKIAILEREICEDKHVVSLRNMVIDLESRLRKALDMRKQRPFLVPPGSGPRCTSTNREILYRGWKVDAMQRAGTADSTTAPEGMVKSASAAALLDLQPDRRTERSSEQPSVDSQRRTFLAVWR